MHASKINLSSFLMCSDGLLFLRLQEMHSLQEFEFRITSKTYLSPFMASQIDEALHGGSESVHCEDGDLTETQRLDALVNITDSTRGIRTTYLVVANARYQLCYGRTYGGCGRHILIKLNQKTPFSDFHVKNRILEF